MKWNQLHFSSAKSTSKKTYICVKNEIYFQSNHNFHFIYLYINYLNNFFNAFLILEIVNNLLTFQYNKIVFPLPDIPNYRDFKFCC